MNNNIFARDLAVGQTFTYDGKGPYVATGTRSGAGITRVTYKVLGSNFEWEFFCKPLSTITLIEN